MKRTVSAVFICFVLITLLSGCSVLSGVNNNVGKTDNTLISVYGALKENLAQRGREGFVLYGARLRVNSENVGSYVYVYTDKRPDDMKYSDILIVEVNNRTGRIEKCSAPDWAEYGAEPYDLISSAMPLEPDKFPIDSDTAVKNAALAHQQNGFVYNYIELTLSYTDGMPVYDIDHISLVNNCIYRSRVDVVTGEVINKSVEEL